MKKRSQDDFVRTALRVPPELHANIHGAATESGRTFNAEIVSRLENSFATTAEATGSNPGDLAALLKRVDTLAANSRATLPTPAWNAKDFAAWPERAPLSDLAMFFALLSHLDYNTAVDMYDALVAGDGRRMHALFSTAVRPLLKSAPYPPEPVEEPSAEPRQFVEQTPAHPKSHRKSA